MNAAQEAVKRRWHEQHVFAAQCNAGVDPVIPRHEDQREQQDQAAHADELPAGVLGPEDAGPPVAPGVAPAQPEPALALAQLLQLVQAGLADQPQLPGLGFAQMASAALQPEHPDDLVAKPKRHRHQLRHAVLAGIALVGAVDLARRDRLRVADRHLLGQRLFHRQLEVIGRAGLAVELLDVADRRQPDIAAVDPAQTDPVAVKSHRQVVAQRQRHLQEMGLLVQALGQSQDLEQPVGAEQPRLRVGLRQPPLELQRHGGGEFGQVLPQRPGLQRVAGDVQHRIGRETQRRRGQLHRDRAGVWRCGVWRCFGASRRAQHRLVCQPQHRLDIGRRGVWRPLAMGLPGRRRLANQQHDPPRTQGLADRRQVARPEGLRRTLEARHRGQAGRRLAGAWLGCGRPGGGQQSRVDTHLAPAIGRRSATGAGATI